MISVMVFIKEKGKRNEGLGEVNFSHLPRIGETIDSKGAFYQVINVTYAANPRIEAHSIDLFVTPCDDPARS